MEPDLGPPIPPAVEDYVIPEESSLLGPCEGVQIEPSSEFVTPLSPTKRFGARIAEDSMVPPESPDMKFARDRLGTLLTSMRQGETPWLNPLDKKPTVETSEFRRGPGRPRKVQNKDKQVVFELRGKPFGLRDGQTESMYQLCRAWMRGKATEPCEPQKPAPPPGDTSLDLLVMRDIKTLTLYVTNMRGTGSKLRTGGELIHDDVLNGTTGVFVSWRQFTTSTKKMLLNQHTRDGDSSTWNFVNKPVLSAKRSLMVEHAYPRTRSSVVLDILLM
nr:CRE-LIN-37 protein [Haemonchus contortus]